jgi:hypothetical protein
VATRLFMVRHGATQLTAENRFAGSGEYEEWLFNDVSHYQDHPRRAQGNLSKWWDPGR